MIPIVEDYVRLIQPGMRVLEVGCGSWEAIKTGCARAGASYEGVDLIEEYAGHKVVATRFEGVQDLSYPDDFFDIVLGNQTMEHWSENGCATALGLYQCFRVCRFGGLVCMNVPIHFHGTSPFLLGRIQAIHALFGQFSGAVRYETWGYPSWPLEPHLAHPNYWRLRQRAAYVLDIVATKDRPVPRQFRKGWPLRGRAAQVFRYPLSYNIYRVLTKFSGAWRLPRRPGP